MPYNCQLGMSPYYNERTTDGNSGFSSNNSSNSGFSSNNSSNSGFSSNNSSNSGFSSNNSSNSSFVKLSTPSAILHYPQEQRIKLSPGTFPPSPLSSPSLSLYANSIPSPLTATASFSEPLYSQDDDDGLQPLDLRIHPNRNEQTLKRTDLEEHKPICMVKSCMCNSQAQHLSQCSTTEQKAERSPHPEMTMSPLNCTDSSSYAKQMITSSTYQGGPSTNTASYLGYFSQSPPWATTESSSFQHLTTSDSVLNGCHNSSNLYRPYGDHFDREDSLPSHEKAKQRESPLLSSKQLDVEVVDSDDEPTYMDLDSATTMSSVTQSRMDYIGRPEIQQRKQDTSFVSSKQNMNTESKREAMYSPHQSTLLQALNSRKDCDSSETKTATCFVGGVISHTSFEKCQKRVPYSTNAIPNYEQAAHLSQQHSQAYLLNSSSPAIGAALITSQSTCYSVSPRTPAATTSQSQCTNGHTYGSSATEGPKFSTTPVSEPQSLSLSGGHVHIDQPARKSPLDKRNSYVNKNRNIRSRSRTAANYFQLPTSTSPNTNESIENNHSRSGEFRDISSVHHPTPDQKDNENSTKISLLDFWISKILMERSSEAPKSSKPCNVDYICTANGEKRIRLRLVDLMELQVEQSLKA